MKKIAIVTDAWHPQINGVVTTLGMTMKNLARFGYQVETVTPTLFRSIPCPSYPEISLAFATSKTVGAKLYDMNPHCVHIATEGPLGWAARAVCKRVNFVFSTSYHTRFPEYLRMRWPVPLSLSYKVVRRFHQASGRTMVATSSLMGELRSRGFTNIALWSRGVDAELFRPDAEKRKNNAPPVLLYVGRVAVEKNIEAFLKIDLPGKKVVVGDGPARRELEERYADVYFAGYRQGEELAAMFASADVFVFPSLTDTFGVVMLEAMASGVPVAAYPVTGPKETVVDGVNGYLHDDLRQAVLEALTVLPDSCRQFALKYSWEACSRQFLDNLFIHDIGLAEL